MKTVLVFLVLVNIVCSVMQNVTDLCENSGCFCQLNGDQTDFPTVDIDCSFNEVEFFIGNYGLPDHVNLLDLSANNFTDINIVSDILNSTTMTRLFLNRNLLTTICEGCLNLPALTYLDLSENRLENIDPAIFKRLNGLKYLNLASNKFKIFSPGNFKSLNILEVLILDDNSVGKHLAGVSLFQENGLDLNPKIEALSLENVALYNLPENFLAEAFNLRHLRLSRNFLTVVPELPYTLEFLDLSDNSITEIDADDFSNMPALKELMLNNLQIIQVPEYTFASMKGLKKLEMQGNRKMKRFNALAFGQDVLDDSDDFMLEELSLRGSLLSTLDESLLEPFSRLTKLDLQGNPWQCDCHLIWIKTLQIPTEDSDHIRCFRPTSLYNSRLMEVEEGALACRAAWATYRRGACLALGALAAALAGVALWTHCLLPRYLERRRLPDAAASGAPYTRIAVEPNTADDFR